jgi:hypothetical protein
MSARREGEGVPVREKKDGLRAASATGPKLTPGPFCPFLFLMFFFSVFDFFHNYFI